MPLFLYSARNFEGQLVSGSEEGPNPESVAKSLEDRGLVPVKIEEKSLESGIFGRFFYSFFGLPKTRDLIIFIRQLSALLGAGVPLLASLKSLENQTQNKRLKLAIIKIEDDIQKGLAFSAALKKHPVIFPEYFSEMVASGEVSGTLKEILDRLTILLENEETTRSRIVIATRYPMLVVIVICVAFIFLIYFVIPKFTAIFSQLQHQLPLPTRILLWVADFSRQNWYLFFLVFIMLVAGYRLYSKTEVGRTNIDAFKLKVPVFGPLVTKILISRMAQILGIMVKSGITINQALMVVSRALDNKVFEKVLKDVNQNVLAGYTLSDPLRKTSLFPPMVVQMIAIGEESGELELMLDQIVNYYQMEIDYTIKNFVTLLEPFLVVFLAIIVLIMALGIFLPMWNLLEIYGSGAF